MSWPRATAKPAADAAVWPKFFAKRITRTRGSAVWIVCRAENVASVLPSSMKIISYVTRIETSTRVSSS